MSCFIHKPENPNLQLNFVVKGVEGNGEGEIETNWDDLQAWKFMFFLCEFLAVLEMIY